MWPQCWEDSYLSCAINWIERTFMFSGTRSFHCQLQHSRNAWWVLSGLWLCATEFPDLQEKSTASVNDVRADRALAEVALGYFCCCFWGGLWELNQSSMARQAGAVEVESFVVSFTNLVCFHFVKDLLMQSCSSHQPWTIPALWANRTFLLWRNVRELTAFLCMVQVICNKPCGFLTAVVKIPE